MDDGVYLMYKTTKLKIIIQKDIDVIM